MQNNNLYIYINRSCYKSLLSTNYNTDLASLITYFTTQQLMPIKISDNAINAYPNIINKSFNNNTSNMYNTDTTLLGYYFLTNDKYYEPPYHNYIVLGTNGNTVTSEQTMNSLIETSNEYIGSLIDQTNNRILLFTNGYYVYSIDATGLNQTTIMDNLIEYNDINYINYKLINGNLVFGTSDTSIFKDTYVELLFITINIEHIPLNVSNVYNSYSLDTIDQAKSIYRIHLNDDNDVTVVKNDNIFETTILTSIKMLPGAAPYYLTEADFRIFDITFTVNEVDGRFTDEWLSTDNEYIWSNYMKQRVLNSLKKWDDIIIDHKHTSYINNKLSIICSLNRFLSNFDALAAAYPSDINSIFYNEEIHWFITKGKMFFNVNYYNDYNNIDNDGLYNTSLHEIGHILGIGSYYYFTNNLTNKYIHSEIINGENRQFYIGQNALDIYKYYDKTGATYKKNINGEIIDTLYKNPLYPTNNCIGIPLENDFGEGSSGSHIEEGFQPFTLSYNNIYKDSIYYPPFGNELMTPLSEGNNIYTPLSAITIAMLEDFNYEVDYTKGDAFDISMITDASFDIGLPQIVITYDENDNVYSLNSVKKPDFVLYRGLKYELIFDVFTDEITLDDNSDTNANEFINTLYKAIEDKFYGRFGMTTTTLEINTDYSSIIDLTSSNSKPDYIKISAMYYKQVPSIIRIVYYIISIEINDDVPDEIYYFEKDTIINSSNSGRFIIQ